MMGLAVDLAFIVYKAVGPDAGRQLVRQSEYFCDINAVGNTVILPVVRSKASTSPAATGSATALNTMGTSCAAAAAPLGRTRSNGHDHINALCGKLLRDGADGRGISLCVFINDLHRIAAAAAPARPTSTASRISSREVCSICWRMPTV